MYNNTITLTQVPDLGVYSFQNRHCTGDGTDRLSIVLTLSLSPIAANSQTTQTLFCLCKIPLFPFYGVLNPTSSPIGCVLNARFHAHSSG